MSDMMELAATLVESGIVVRLCNKSFEYKHKSHIWLKSAVLFVLLAAGDILLGNRRGSENLNAVLLLLTVCGYVLLFFKGKIYERVLISFFPVMIILPINLFLINAFRMLSGSYAMEVVMPGGSLRLPLLLFSKLGFFLACEMLIHMRRRGRYPLDAFQWIIQLSGFVMTFLIAYFMLYISMGDEQAAETAGRDQVMLFFGVSMVVVVLNVLLYVLMGKMHRDSMMKEEYRVSKMNLAAQERFVNEARERYTEMRTLRHDMRHYLLTATELISAGRAEEAKDYMETVIHEKVDRTAVGVDTGNVVVDAVINSRIAVCLQQNIQIKCMIDSQFGEVSDMDLSIVLSNALDNAINGCRGVDDPKIELVIGSRKSLTRIVVKNSIAESVLSKNPGLETDKADRSAHGFGIASMRKIA